MNVWPLAVVRLYGNQAYGQGAVFGPYIVLLQFVSMQMNSFFAEATSGTALMAHLMVLSLSVATAGRICDDIRCGQFVPVSHLALL